MSTHRIDRTGHVYGAATVLGVDPDNPRLWRLRWGCCGKEQSVSVERCSSLVKQVPQRCILCWRKIDSTLDAYSRKQAEDAERRRQARITAPAPYSQPDILVVKTPGGGWWPELGRMGAK